MIFHKTIEKVYKTAMFSRCDDTGLLHYFSHEDFRGMEAMPYSFSSSLGHTLNGYFYSYIGYDPKRLVVFDHGFGGGHRSYMKEIEKLAKEGYLVFAYDHTGCMTSGGEGAGGLCQSLRDLDDCLKALKRDCHIASKELYVVGHSWGGFSTLNIAKYHPDVKKIVVFAGFASVEKMLEQNFPGMLQGYQPYIYALEKQANADYVTANAVETLKNSQVQALLIYDEKDGLVQKAFHYDVLYDGLHENDRISFMLTKGKGHNPNYTAAAVAHLGALTKQLKKAKKLKTPQQKQAFRDKFDWNAMTEQDHELWEKIFLFLA